MIKNKVANTCFISLNGLAGKKALHLGDMMGSLARAARDWKRKSEGCVPSRLAVF